MAKIPALSPSDVESRLADLSGWTLNAQGRLERTFRFKDFLEALAFANRVGAEAEEADHHPDLHVSYGRLRVELTTHDAGGLTERDFALAGAIDGLPQG